MSFSSAAATDPASAPAVRRASAPAGPRDRGVLGRAGRLGLPDQGVDPVLGLPYLAHHLLRLGPDGLPEGLKPRGLLGVPAARGALDVQRRLRAASARAWAHANAAPRWPGAATRWAVARLRATHDGAHPRPAQPPVGR